MRHFIFVFTVKVPVQGFSVVSFDIKFTRQGFENLRLPSDSTCILKVEPGKLDVKRHKPGILFISLPIVSLLKLAIMM